MNRLIAARLEAVFHLLRCPLNRYLGSRESGDQLHDLMEQLRGDYDFQRVSDDLHMAAIATQFQEPPVLDCGSYLRSLTGQPGRYVTLRFELSFLTPHYFVSPAELAIRLDQRHHWSGVIRYSAGALDRNGSFQTREGRNVMYPSDDAGWAFLYSDRFGDAGLESRRNGQR